MQLEDLLECTSNAVRVQLDGSCCTNISLNPRFTLLEVTHVQFGSFLRWSAQECDWNVSNVIGTPYEYLECNWNEVRMQLESFEHWQNIPTTHKNGPE